MTTDLLQSLLTQNSYFDMYKQCIVLAYRGSKAHGTFIPNSNPGSIDDIDLLGIAIPTEKYIFGLSNFEQYEAFEGVWDILIYDFRKAMRLFKKSNPNILQLLWTHEDYIMQQTKALIIAPMNSRKKIVEEYTML